MTDLNAKLAAAGPAYTNWIEDTIAGLLINGVSREDIEIQHNDDLSTIVLVRGEPRYKYDLVTGEELLG